MQVFVRIRRGARTKSIATSLPVPSLSGSNVVRGARSSRLCEEVWDDIPLSWEKWRPGEQWLRRIDKAISEWE
jgi:hypothetical protein